MIEATRQRRRLDDRIRALLDLWSSGANDPAIARRLMSDLSNLPAFDVKTLQDELRKYLEFRQWRTKDDRPAKSLQSRFSLTRMAPASAPPIHWLDILHSNGYVREAALRAIDDRPPGPVFLAALLLRLNDNAAPVREAAKQCLMRISEQLSAEMTIAVLPTYLEKMPFWERLEAQHLVDSLMKSPSVLSSAKSALLNNSEGWLPRFFRNLLTTDIADVWLPDLALNARQPAIRARSVTALMEGKVDKLPGYRDIVISERLGSVRRVFSRDNERRFTVAFDRRALISSAAGDRSVKVRKAAAQGLVLHYWHIDDLNCVFACFDGETNKAILERLDFVRRRVAQGAHLPPDMVL